MRSLKEGVLQIFVLRGGKYELWEDWYLPEVGIGLTFWRGVYEKKEDTYLRWRHRDGNLLPTGLELADREAERASRESERAAHEAERAEQEAQVRQAAERRAEMLAAKLREMGLNPDQI